MQNRNIDLSYWKARDNMTESEAIEKLRAYCKCQILQAKGIYEDCNEELCDNCDLCYAQGNIGEHIKSIEIAIQALEKQIPKKPHKNFEKFSGVWCSCGKYFGKGYFVDKPIYCPNCGQKLDWSDEK